MSCNSNVNQAPYSYFNSPSCAEMGNCQPQAIPYFQNIEQFQSYLSFASQFGIDKEKLIQHLIYSRQMHMQQPIDQFYSIQSQMPFYPQYQQNHYAQDVVSQPLFIPSYVNQLQPQMGQDLLMKQHFEKQLQSQMTEEEIVQYYRDQQRQSANLSFMQYNMARQQ